MGIQGLLPLLKEISSSIHVKQYRGKSIAVDAYVWLHRGAYGCAEELATNKPTVKYVNYAMHRLRMLKYHGITPIIVFDGGLLPSKMGTEVERERRRSDALARGNAFLAEGKKSQARDCFTKGVDVTPEMAYQLIKALIREGVQYIVAPYEADPQLAYLERVGIVDGIITEDSDLLVFGCRAVLFKLDSDGNCIEILRAKFAACKEFNFAGWTDTEFRMMAILSGCDYLDSIPGMGLKTAYRLVRKYKTIEKILQSVRLTGQLTVPTNYLEGFKRAELTFRYQRVWDPINKILVHCNPLPEGLHEDDLHFAGPPLTNEYARGLATGEIDPISKLPVVDINPSAFPPIIDGQPTSSFKPTKSKTTSKSVAPVKGAGSLLNYFAVKSSSAPQKSGNRNAVASGSTLKVLGITAKNLTNVEKSIPPLVVLESKFFGSKDKGKGRGVEVEMLEEGEVILTDQAEEEDEFPDDEVLDYDRIDGTSAAAEALFQEEIQVDDEDSQGMIDIERDSPLLDIEVEEVEEATTAEQEDLDYAHMFPRPERLHPLPATIRRRKRSNSTGLSISSFADISSPTSSSAHHRQQPHPSNKKSRMSVKSVLEDVEEDEKMIRKRSGSSTDGGISSPPASMPEPHLSSPPLMLPSLGFVKMEKGIKQERTRKEEEWSGKSRMMISSDPIAGSSESGYGIDEVEDFDEAEDSTPRARGSKVRTKGKARASTGGVKIKEEKTLSQLASDTPSSGSKRKTKVLTEEETERNEAAAIVGAGWKAKFMNSGPIASNPPRRPLPLTASSSSASKMTPTASRTITTASNSNHSRTPISRIPLSPKNSNTSTRRMMPMISPPLDDKEEQKGTVAVKNLKLLAFRFKG